MTLQPKWFHQFQFAGYYAAEAEGYYREAGLDVRFVEASPRTDAVEEVLSGRAQFGVGDSRLVAQRAAGKPVVALAVITQHSPAVIVTSRALPGSGITAIRGRHVMVEPSDAEILAYLKREGVTPDQLQLLPHTYRMQDLVDGRTDAITAYATSDLYALDQAGFPYQAYSPRAAGVDFYGDNLFTSEEQIRRHPDQVKAFRAASLRGWSYAMAHTDEMVDLILSRYPTKKDRSELQYEARRMAELIQPDLVEMGYMNPQRWRQIADTLSSQGMVPAGFSLKGFLYEPEPAQDLTWLLRTAAALLAAGACGFLLYIHRTHSRLRDLHEFYRQVVQSAQEGIIVYRTDGRIRVWNRFMAQLAGRPEAEVLGRSLHEVIPALDGTQVPESIEAALRGEVPPRLAFQIEFPGHPEPRWLTSTMAPLLGDGGAVTGAIGIVTDITERKQAEESLRIVHTSMEQSPVSVVIADTSASILYVNPAFTRVTGYQAAEVLGRNPRLLQSGTHGADFYHGMWACLASGAVWSGEIINRKKSGEFFTEKTVIAPVRNDRGVITHYVAIKEDVTDAQRAEEEKRTLEAQLHQAQKLESLGSLAGGVAHDMNNVLGAVLGSASLLYERVETPADKKTLDIIMKACLRGRGVINSLLTFARKDIREERQIDLNELVHETIGLLKHTTLMRVELKEELEDGLGFLRGDAGALGNTLMNLCVNAIDAMEGQGTLTLRTASTPEGGLAIHVVDTGRGMTEEVLARAVDPFFTTKPTGKGTGLGLSMVHGTMKAHDGTLELRSEPGQGTQAILTFPDIRVAPSVAEVQIPTWSPRGARTGLEILVVDDDPLVRDSLAESLSHLGHHPRSAAGGQEALEILEEPVPVDLVILDHNMPVMNGAEALTRILALRPGLPVLMVTGHREEDILPLLEAHANVRDLHKPFSLRELEQRIQELAP